MTERTNLYAFTEAYPPGGYPGFVSLNREPDGSTTLIVRSPGHNGEKAGMIALPADVQTKLGAALKFDVDTLVDRFLQWPVPASVWPDGKPGEPGRTGTNLLSAEEARLMLRHVLGG